MTLHITPVMPDWEGLRRNLRREGTPRRWLGSTGENRHV